MAFESPTLEERIEQEKAAIRALIPGADTSDGSDYDINARVHSMALRGTDANIAYQVRQSLPTTVEGDSLLEQCRVRGIEPLPAAASSGRVLVTSTSNGDVLPSGSTLTHASGIEYTTDATGTTSTPLISGKTVGEGFTAFRLPVLGTVAGLAYGMPIKVGGVPNVIRDVLTSIDAIEVFWPVDLNAITVGAAITAQCGVVVPVTATTPGANGNQASTDILTIGSPVGDIDAEAEILDLAGGGDDETEAQLRGRLLDWMADRPGAGNLADYRDWVRTTPGLRLDDAFIYPGKSGLGTIGCIPFGVSGARQIAETQVALVEAQLTAEAPYADAWDVSLFTFGGHDVDLVVNVKPGTGYEQDWPDDSSFSTHPTTPCTTTKIYFAGSIMGLEVGDRLIVRVPLGGIYYPYQVAVTELVPMSGYVSIDPPLPGIPDVAFPIKSGGPLFEPVYAAVQALFDDLGPGDTSPTPSRYPAPSIVHPDVLPKAACTEAVMSVAGVMDCNFVGSSGFSGDSVIPDAYERVRLTSFSIVWL